MWRRLRRGNEEKAELVALVGEDGILISGPTGVLDEVVARLASHQGIKARLGADQAAAAASAMAAVTTQTEYVRLSPASSELLRTYGAVPGEGGYFRMFVHDQAKKIAAQLQWEKANLAPEQALSLQMAAVGLALRTALADVQQSVERIEGKLDRVTRLLRAERRGNALGDHRTLTNLVERVRASGRISPADWQSVAGLGPEIGRDLEGLRAHIRSMLEREDESRLTWTRAAEAERLLEDDWLAEALALLAVVEHNFSLWQELRLAYVAAYDHNHLAEIVGDAGRQLEAQTASDQAMLDVLVDYATVVADPRLFDGLDLVNAGKLRRARDELDLALRWFADQRLLDMIPLAEEPFPRFRESFGHLAKKTAQASKAVAAPLRRLTRRSPSPPALEAATDNDGVEES